MKSISVTLIISEAMHGAILADILRVPWQAVSFAPNFCSFKWYDWTEALNINLKIESLPFVVQGEGISFNRKLEDFFNYQLLKLPFKQKTNRINTYEALKNSPRQLEALIIRLQELKSNKFQLSSNHDLNLVVSKLNNAVAKLNEDISNY